MAEISRGSVWWADLDPVRGREQAGRRPVLVVASNQFLAQADTLAIVIPVTTQDRGWPNHIQLAGDIKLGKPSFAMTEQIRTITRERLNTKIGNVDQAIIDAVSLWLRDFLAL